MSANTTSCASVNEPVDHGDCVSHPISFGKVSYESGAPKSLPRWVWRCGCDKCRELPPQQGMHGPFKTARAAERDAQQFLELYYAELGSAAN
jgi:hypothetical protein